MKTMVQPPAANEIVQITLAGTVASGLFIDLPGSAGNMVGVHAQGGVIGDVVSVYTGGIYRCDKASADGAWSVGTPLFLNDSAQEFTTTSSTHNPAGVAAEAATSGAVIGLVKLIPATGV